jgi:chemotaxis protein MotB
MATMASRRRGGADYTWPGYVDALTTLLMVLIFLLSLFSVAQDLEQLTVQLRQARGERDRLGADLTAERRSADALKVERDQLTERLTSMLTERDRLSAALQSQAREAEAKAAAQQREAEARAAAQQREAEAKATEAATRAGDLQKEIERQRLELTRLAASLAAANQEKGRLFGDLTEEQKLTAEQKAAVVRLTAELAGVKDELSRLNAALDASEAKTKGQEAQIVDLGQKLNRALASKVEELARYRSEFFGKLREALAGQRDVQVVGDRFVFQSEVLFPSGSAQLQPAGEKQLAEVAQRLLEIAARIPKDINWVLQVDGHTDDKPIRNVVYPSNWELSAARAIAVVKFLHSQGIPNERLVAAGYGEYQPLSAIDSARNRRIELKLTSR